MSRARVALMIIQRQFGPGEVGITSVYLRGIDDAEIIQQFTSAPR